VGPEYTLPTPRQRTRHKTESYFEAGFSTMNS